jgi:hypothetical protein
VEEEKERRRAWRRVGWRRCRCQCRRGQELELELEIVFAFVSKNERRTLVVAAALAALLPVCLQVFD